MKNIFYLCAVLRDNYALMKVFSLLSANGGPANFFDSGICRTLVQIGGSALRFLLYTAYNHSKGGMMFHCDMQLCFYSAPETAVCEIEEAALICVSGDGQNEGYDEYPINW